MPLLAIVNQWSERIWPTGSIGVADQYKRDLVPSARVSENLVRSEGLPGFSKNLQTLSTELSLPVDNSMLSRPHTWELDGNQLYLKH